MAQVQGFAQAFFVRVLAGDVEFNFDGAANGV